VLVWVRVRDRVSVSITVYSAVYSIHLLCRPSIDTVTATSPPHTQLFYTNSPDGHMGF